MNGPEILRIVDAMHRDKGIPKDMIFEGIEQGMHLAARKHFGVIDQEHDDIVVSIDRATGMMTATKAGVELDPQILGRIAAQVAKQVFIQKIREAERDALYNEYESQRGQLTTGVVQRYEGGAATVQLTNTEAILPRSEQIPGETHHANERVRATVFEVRKVGTRVKVILSRIRPDLVRRMFEQEIPEIADGVIEVRAMAREAGYRTKVAVSSTDQRVDCVGACVGVRGNRIKNIVDELAGERIDIVRWSDDMQVLIPNALQPAEVEEVILCQMLGRAIVLVREDQLSLAIGRRGQNVRLASQLVSWKIDIHPESKISEFKDELRYFLTQNMPELDSEQVEFMFKLGFHSAENIINADSSELLSVPDLDQETAEKLQEVCEDLLEARATGKLWGAGGRQGAMQRLSAGEVKPAATSA